ncbi:hypothetical protein [Streptomyces althioticus]|uniref:amidohydrolase family protein n=1 Tax=Streptomyces althioticus TaxID=83380 RepID=UPI0036B2BF89
MNGPKEALTVLRGARLIVGDGKTVHERADLVLAGERIHEIREHTSASDDEGPEGVEVVDCSGKTIMPAIVNPHGHIGYMRGTTSDAAFFSEENVLDHLRRLTYHGVSTFRSLGTDRDGVELAVRDRQRAHPNADPELATLLSAGSGLVAPTPGAPNGGPFFAVNAVHETSGAEDATRFVRHLAEKNVDIVKFWVDDRGGTKAKLGPEIQRAVVAEAHRQRRTSTPSTTRSPPSGRVPMFWPTCLAVPGRTANCSTSCWNTTSRSSPR